MKFDLNIGDKVCFKQFIHKEWVREIWTLIGQTTTIGTNVRLLYFREPNTLLFNQVKGLEITPGVLVTWKIDPKWIGKYALEVSDYWIERVVHHSKTPCRACRDLK